MSKTEPLSNCKLHNAFRWSIPWLTMKIGYFFPFKKVTNNMWNTSLNNATGTCPTLQGCGSFCSTNGHIPVVTAYFFITQTEKISPLHHGNWQELVQNLDSRDCVTFSQMSYKLLEACLNYPDGPKILQKRRKPNGMWLIWSQGCDFQPLVIKSRSKSAAKKKKPAAWG